MQNVFERKTGKIYFVQYDFFLTEISKGLVKTSIMKCPKHKSKQRLKQESKHTLNCQDGRTEGQFIHYCQFQCTMLPARQPAALAASPQTQPPLFQPLCSDHKPPRIHHIVTQCSNYAKRQMRGTGLTVELSPSACICCSAECRAVLGRVLPMAPFSLPLQSAFCSSALGAPAAAIIAGFYKRLLTKAEVEQVWRDRVF